MARKKLRQIKRSLKRTERVVVRNQKGQYRKYRKDLKLVLHVVDKKGKVIGVLNQVKDGKPIPRRFSGGQFTILSKPKMEPGFEIRQKGDSFRISSSKPIVHQLPGSLTSQIKRLAKKSPMGTIIASFEIYRPDGMHLFTKGYVFDGTEKMRDMRMAIAVLIRDTLYSINVRISAKAHTSRAKNKLARYIDVTPQFS